MNAAKWQVSPLLFPGIGLGLSLRVKCPARVPLAGQHSSVAVARNVLHLEAVPLTERSTSLYRLHELENRLDHDFLANRSVQHDVIEGPSRPFNIEIALNKIDAIAIDRVH